MTPDDIAKARCLIAAASKGPALWTFDVLETEEVAFARLRLAFDDARAITKSTALHTVEVERRDDGSCLVMAFTGNGPKSPENARYIAGSFDPVAGWAAALDEVERMTLDNTVLRNVADAGGKATYALEDQCEQTTTRIRALETALHEALNQWSADVPGEDDDRDRLRKIAEGKAP